MFLDEKNIGLGKIVINDSIAKKNIGTNKYIEIPIKSINIYSNDETYVFTFWTQREYHEYNELPLNIKTDVMDMIDDYDIDFGTEEEVSINSRENAKVFFTRIDDNKYIINAEINDFSNSVIGNSKDYNSLKLEAIIDFNN